MYPSAVIITMILMVRLCAEASAPPQGHNERVYASKQRIALRCQSHLDEQISGQRWLKFDSMTQRWQDMQNLTHKGNLVIKSAKESDTGTYACEFMDNQGRSQMALHRIKVKSSNHDQIFKSSN